MRESEISVQAKRSSTFIGEGLGYSRSFSVGTAQDDEIWYLCDLTHSLFGFFPH